MFRIVTVMLNYEVGRACRKREENEDYIHNWKNLKVMESLEDGVLGRIIVELLSKKPVACVWTGHLRVFL
jgi:hypothetical protein